MNIKKTEEFLYFQNKARHYANLRGAKPAVKTRRNSSPHSYLQGSDRIPYFKRYDMERQNQGLINRITDIMTGPRYQVEKQGYTRYNHSFVPKSHFTIEQRRSDESIDEGNERIAYKVLNAKPSIGTINDWNKQYRHNRQIRSNISKYNDRRTSKGTLQVYKSTNFMPQHYRSFLNRSLNKRTKEENEENPQQLPKNMKIKVQELFQLPKLKKLRGSMTRIGENGQEVEHF